MKTLVSLALAALAIAIPAQTVFQETITITTVADTTTGSTAIVYGSGQELVAAVATLPDSTGTTWTVDIANAAGTDLITWGSLAENDAHYLEPQDASEIGSATTIAIGSGWIVEAVSATTEATAQTVTVDLFYKTPVSR